MGYEKHSKEYYDRMKYIDETIAQTKARLERKRRIAESKNKVMGRPKK